MTEGATEMEAKEEVTMHRFYTSFECPNCDNVILNGPNGTLIEHHGLPVIPFDIAAQETFECEQCGALLITGDFPYLDDDED